MPGSHGPMWRPLEGERSFSTRRCIPSPDLRNRCPKDGEVKGTMGERATAWIGSRGRHWLGRHDVAGLGRDLSTVDAYIVGLEILQSIPMKLSPWLRAVLRPDRGSVCAFGGMLCGRMRCDAPRMQGDATPSSVWDAAESSLRVQQWACGST